MENKQKYLIIGGSAVLVCAIVLFFLFRGNLTGKIVIPYITHQKPLVDPHLPSSNPVADKLDEVLYDGLFNKSATISGITFENGLGSLVKFENNIATVKVKENVLWHSSYSVDGDDENAIVKESEAKPFTVKDIDYSLRRVQRLKSLSPDFVMVYQALDDFAFRGPNSSNEIFFKFKDDRVWTEDEVKETLSFKIIPTGADSEDSFVGTGPYLFAFEKEHERFYLNNPNTEATLKALLLEPFIDNSTFATELDNSNINVLLNTPFGSENPILNEKERFFTKSNISTTFFSLVFNTERVTIEKRKEYRRLIDHKQIMNRFYRIGTEQQRHVMDYKGNKDNYDDYLNSSVFPSSSYYVNEDIVMPAKLTHHSSISVADTLDVKVSLNYGNREELAELAEIMNELYGKYVHVSSAKNEDILTGNYDALLLPVSGYRSNFLYDLYPIFLRDPDLENYKINLKLNGNTIDLTGVEASNNLFRMNPSKSKEQQEFYTNIFEFMATSEIGDKQYYAGNIDRIEHHLALGVWLFSLPSLSYFSTQFDSTSIHLYGTASQLSTIEKWKERKPAN